jgi:hypothetical protein
MKTMRLELVLTLGFLGVSVISAAAGQRPAHPVPRAGEEVIVTQTASGEELRGHLVELSSASMALLVDGRRVEIPIDNVLRIDIRHDSLKNGTIIGAAVMGGLAALGCAAAEDVSQCATVLVLNTGFGALAGAGIDALHRGRSPIYIKAGKSTAALQVRLQF